MAEHFAEKSGVVACKTPWGQWYQLLDEVHIEVSPLPDGTTARQISVQYPTPSTVTCLVRGAEVFSGQLFSPVVRDQCVWTLEDDRRTLHLQLVKAAAQVGNPRLVWSALFASGECAPDAWTLRRMEEKVTLQRFQAENPGMDFSGAEVSGTVGSAGGPLLPPN